MSAGGRNNPPGRPGSPRGTTRKKRSHSPSPTDHDNPDPLFDPLACGSLPLRLQSPDRIAVPEHGHPAPRGPRRKRAPQGDHLRGPNPILSPYSGAFPSVGRPPRGPVHLQRTGVGQRDRRYVRGWRATPQTPSARPVHGNPPGGRHLHLQRPDPPGGQPPAQEPPQLDPAEESHLSASRTRGQPDRGREWLGALLSQGRCHRSRLQRADRCRHL